MLLSEIEVIPEPIENPSSPPSINPNISSDLTRDDSDDSDYHPPSNMESCDDYDTLSSIIQKDSFHQREQMEYGIISPIINPELPCSIQEAIPDLDFIEFDQYVRNLDEEGQRAITILQQRYNFPWSTNHLNFDDKIQLKYTHYWDYIALNGMSWCSMGLRGGQFRTIKFSLKHWSKSYQNTRYFTSSSSHSIPYTIHLGSDTRLQLYLICYFSQTSDNSEHNEIQTLSDVHFKELYSLIVNVFENTPQLCHYGINSSCKYQDFNIDISYVDWKLFQDVLFATWQSYFDDRVMSFWKKITPSMHIIDYGGNIRLTKSVDESIDLIQLNESVSLIFDVDNLHSFSFAIATEINATLVLNDQKSHSIVLLSKTSAIKDQFPASLQHKLHIYPIAFSKDVCCWQSKIAPQKYQLYVNNFPGNEWSSLDEPIIVCNSVQGYQSIDKQIRSNPMNWCFKDSPYPSGLNVLSSQVPKSKQTLLQKLNSSATKHEPINTFLNAIQVAKNNGQCHYRFEPVFTVQWHLIPPEKQQIEYLIHDIIQPIIKFWPVHGRDWLQSQVVPIPYWVISFLPAGCAQLALMLIYCLSDANLRRYIRKYSKTLHCCSNRQSLIFPIEISP